MKNCERLTALLKIFMVATSPLRRTLKNKDIKYSTRELIHRQI